MNSFHSHHSPFGAFASFTIGLEGSTGGFGLGLSGPANQNVYVGYRQAGGDWNLLPFFATSTESMESAYTGEGEPITKEAKGNRIATGNAYTRKLTPGTDQWNLDDLTFTLQSFAGPADPPDGPNARYHHCPAVIAVLEYANTGSVDVELVFGVGNPDGPWRPLKDHSVHPELMGFEFGGQYGFATWRQAGIREVQAFSVLDPQILGPDGLHRIAPEAGFVVTVPAGESVRVPIALGFYQGGAATTGIPTRYTYASLFSKLEDVLEFAAVHLAAHYENRVEGNLSPDDRGFLYAQSVHSYYGSTQLLDSSAGQVFVVHEGEYRMMNTFDLTVDHLFFELDHHPWAVANVLKLFWDRYSYTDTTHKPDGTPGVGGIAFTHDMGVNNHFTPARHSSYECPNLTGCFSYMSTEELLNFTLCWAGFKIHHGSPPTQDILTALMESILNRDDPDPALRNGLFAYDSDRCGPTGAEITTYDSLDASLGQTRNNLYMAVKALGAFLLVEEATDDATMKALAREAADRVVATLESKFDAGAGMWPAVFEGGNQSRIIPACEGLVYPLAFGIHGQVAQRYPAFLAQMSQHLKNVLQVGTCIDPVSKGWKLSSTSKNTWFSKIAICQYVVQRMFPEALSPEAAQADKVHADWQRGPCGPWAMCDQIHSETGAPMGSRYYPRGVTTWLWYRP